MKGCFFNKETKYAAVETKDLFITMYFFDTSLYPFPKKKKKKEQLYLLQNEIPLLPQSPAQTELGRRHLCCSTGRGWNTHLSPCKEIHTYSIISVLSKRLVFSVLKCMDR